MNKKQTKQTHLKLFYLKTERAASHRKKIKLKRKYSV